MVRLSEFIIIRVSASWRVVVTFRDAFDSQAGSGQTSLFPVSPGFT